MNKKTYFDVIDAAASTHIPDGTDLAPRILAHIQKGKGASMQPRLKILTAVLTAIVIFNVLVFGWPTVARALYQLLGYIPVVGVVDLSVPIRRLDAPASQTRDGLTVTVESALLSSERTIIHAKGIPQFIPATADRQAPDEACSPFITLRLPDGTIVGGNAGNFTGNIPGSVLISGAEVTYVNGDHSEPEDILTLGPVPADVDMATLVISCNQDTPPGAIIKSWELPLKFVPAAPDLKPTPIIEVIPTQGADAAAGSENPLVIKKVLDIGDSYVLMGEFSSDLVKTALHGGSSAGVTEVTFKDANGRAVDYSLPDDSIKALWPPFESGPLAWAYQIKKGFAAPLTITSTVTRFGPPPSRMEFEFDAGQDPQPGQQWLLNKDFDIGGHAIRLVSITLNSRQGYVFHLQSDDPDAPGFNLEISGHPSLSMSSGASEVKRRTPVSEDTFELDYYLSILLPKGMLKIVISPNESVPEESRTYQLQWSPEPTSIEPYVTPTP